MHPIHSSSRSTRELAGMVRGELRWVDGLDPSAVAVTEHHGHVALIGTVGSWAEREGAVRAARRVPGIRSIETSGLRVRVCAAGTPRDSELKHAAQEAIRWHLASSHDAVHATARDGVVVLAGRVARPWERDAAEAAVRAIEGVRAIDDRIQVGDAR